MSCAPQQKEDVLGFISTFDIFKPGVGPSSSHTMGPMTAGYRFAQQLLEKGGALQVARVEVELMGSLAATGIGHHTDLAVQIGLSGSEPATVDTETIEKLLREISVTNALRIGGRWPISFLADKDIVWTKSAHPRHPNAIRFTAFDERQAKLDEELYFSIGGGFIVAASEAGGDRRSCSAEIPFAFADADDLLRLSEASGLSIAAMMYANERLFRSEHEIADGLDALWTRMEKCISRGLSAEGILPGKLKVPRRAKKLYGLLAEKPEILAADPLAAMDFVNVWALAVNEENAAGGAVVTAPTNGAAGIVPAVISYYRRFRGGDDKGVRDFLLTAAAIGSLYKRNASLSGAEVGCQGEVGVACSMAAAGLTAVLGGTSAQIENAAEIGMEHNLGLTCDPIAGLVQIPCIERNAMGAIKAIDASRLALLGDGIHHVSLDKVIATMRATGADMHSRYKETSEGGLAVSFVEC